jgi:hypothetical protein
MGMNNNSEESLPSVLILLIGGQEPAQAILALENSFELSVTRSTGS